MKSVSDMVLSGRRFQSLATASFLSLCGHTFSLSAAEGAEPLPLGSPPVLEHSTPTGSSEVAQRLIPFPFMPPDVKPKESGALSPANH